MANKVFGTDTFTVGADTNIDAYPSGAVDYAYNISSGTRLTVNAANDRVQVTAASSGYARIIRSGMPTGDQETRATGGSTAAWDSPAICVRMATSGNLSNFYYLSNEGVVAIYRVDDGAHTLVASADRGVAGSATRSYRIQAIGTDPVLLEAQIDATAVVTYSDSNANRKTSGLPGIGGYDSVANTIWADNIEVYDFAIIITRPRRNFPNPRLRTAY